LTNSLAIKLLSGGAATLVLAVLLLAGPAPTDRPQPAPTDDIVPGRYIVVLRDGRDPDRYAGILGQRYGFVADLVYRHALKGFAADLSHEAASALSSESDVRMVEPDRIVAVSDQELPTGIDRTDADVMLTGTDPAPDVDIAIIDTGVDIDHPDLRVVGGVSFNQYCNSIAGSYDDDHGHGTHVAGTAAARDNDIGVVGMAPGARIWAVKVLHYTAGAMTCAIAGVDWVTAHADVIDVANMSIRAGLVDADNPLCAAISNSVAAGVVYIAAAGNGTTDEGVDATTTTPANCPDVITVSAIVDSDGAPGGVGPPTGCGPDDSLANFSNRGPLVEIAAPGCLIRSTWPGGGSNYDSGTSMAAGHASGAAALYMTTRNVNPANAAEVASFRTAFLSDCTVPQSDPNLGFSGDPDGSPEPLLYLGTNCAASPVVTPTPTPIPTATPAATPTPAAADYDGDGVPDSSDNCPAWPNADQSQPPWPIETGDPDCDGWTTDGEAAIGTDPMDPCPDDQLDDAWPPDVDNSGRVSTTDVLTFAPVMQQQPGDASYDPRLDLGGGEGINIIDVLLLGSVIQRSCQNP